MTHQQTIVNSALGWVFIAGTPRGLSAIRFGESRRVLKKEPTNTHFNHWVRRVVDLIEHPGKKNDLPLDIRGTAFQKRVWQMLGKIPAGQTASYSEVARRIGQPTAVRAVASACGANPVAVVIPCHRVIGANGKLTGYRWGLKRKQQLLEKEKGL